MIHSNIIGFVNWQYKTLPEKSQGRTKYLFMTNSGKTVKLHKVGLFFTDWTGLSADFVVHCVWLFVAEMCCNSFATCLTTTF